MNGRISTPVLWTVGICWLASSLAWALPARGAGVQFTERVISTSVHRTISVSVTDLDGDGDTDVLTGGLGNRLEWYESDGGSPPTFTQHLIWNIADGADSVLAADVDGDGDIDVLAALGHEDKIAWYENDGGSPPTFTERVISTTADGPIAVFATDLDGDGDIDVLSASFADDKIAWYENDGGSSPTFTERVISTNANFALSVFAADVDGDGDTDVLSASMADDKIAWYENDGGSPPSFRERVISTTAVNARSVFATDVDGDGDIDVLSASIIDDKIAWYENDGGSPPFFIERVISTAADNAVSVFAMDLDGDGDTDVLSASRDDDKIAWYENDGGSPPTFTERVISTAADEATSVFAADMDGDGDIDVLSASQLDGKIAWYENTICGDGVVEGGEECDDGLGNSDTEPDACRTDCTAASCGDGVFDTGEECEDENNVDGDGCSSACTVENGFLCTGQPSVCIRDCNGNGIPDQSDILAGTSADCNGNGIPDECNIEEDCNGNGIPDDCDIEDGTSEDCNGNGIPDECNIEEDCNGNGNPDECDIATGTSLDCNDNGIPDECNIEEDCNGNQNLDECDIASGMSLDCNGNGIPDECDIENGASDDCNSNIVPDECEDCNGNGIGDSCDIAAGTSEDCTGNGIPDECEPDCNSNSTADSCDIAAGTSEDCTGNTGNGIPDECEPDCNSNGTADSCDIAAGTSLDCNDNGTPDECETGCSGALMELKWLAPQGSAADPYPTCGSGGATTGVDTADLTIPRAGPNGQTLWLGIFISGWGDQADLKNVQGKLDSGSLPAGLSVLRLACPGDDDQLCEDELGTGVQAGCNINPISNNTCSPAFIDTSRADAIPGSPSGEGLYFSGCQIATDDVACGAGVGGGNKPLTDTGSVLYVGTIVLSASQSLAGGPHKVRLFAPNGHTFMNDGSIDLGVTSATLSIETGRCCFNPGQSDPACADPITGVTSDNQCTDNFCDSNQICQNPPIAGWDQANVCCDPTDGSFTAIDDEDSCTDDSCSLDGVGAGLGVAQHVVLSEGTDCDDGNACTYDDQCNEAGGGCTGSDINIIDCNDDATCDALVTGTYCSDGACQCLHPLGSTVNPFGIPGGGNMNRAGGFTMPASAVAGGGGKEVAIRVTLRRLYIDKDEDPVNGCPVGPDFSSFENQVRYLGPPSAFDDNDTGSTPQFVAAELQCTPYYRDWSPAALTADFGAGVDTSTIYYYGVEVLPCSVYEAQQATQACIDEFATDDCFSTALQIRTALWGDVWTPFGVVSFTDIGKVVDSFKSLAFVPGNPPDGAPRKVQAMLRDNSASLVSTINFTDVGKVVDAFKTIAYAEDGPTDCP